MKFKQIATYLGITQAALADMAGVSKQSLTRYNSGERGKPSDFVANVLQVAGLNREEVFFADGFNHPNGDTQEHPAYWLNLAAEAINEAEKRGLPPGTSEQLRQQIFAAGTTTLSEL